ncbi:MAG: hypothetical protein KME21_30790, partial [Desmonostoc vinosum HA7617-LM4]|nr:hypothetical protein [Desmonostoc vinosum HA7617-LM4]
YVEQQAKTVALEEIKTVEISFGDHEVYAANELIASITIDDDLTQPWVVMVNHVEVFRDSTYKRCHSFIIWHYKQGSLPKPEQQASTDTAETACTTGNEVMAQIANECEKFELDLMDDGIYCNDVKLGEVGCSDGSWWVVRASSEHKNRVPCDSVAEAVWSLRMVEVLASGDVDQERTSCESLLDKPVDEVTISEWERLKKYYASLNETSELVAA